MSLGLILVLQYSTYAKAVTSGREFYEYVLANASGEYIFPDFVEFSEPTTIPVFSGVIDAKGNVLQLMEQPFDVLENCTIKNIAIVGYGTQLANVAKNVTFIGVEFFDTSVGDMQNCQVLQSWVQMQTMVFANISDSYFGGSVINSSLEDAIPVLKNTVLSSSFIRSNKRLASYVFDCEFRHSRLLRKSADEWNPIGFALDIENSVFDDTDVYFSLVSVKDSSTALSTSVVKTTFTNVSFALNESSLDTYRTQGIASQLSQSSLQQVTIEYNVEVGNILVGFYGVALQSSNSNVTDSLVIGAVHFRGTTELEGSLVYQMLDEYSHVTRMTLNCEFLTTLRRQANISGLANYLRGTVSDVSIIGSFTSRMDVEDVKTVHISPLANVQTGTVKNTYIATKITVEDELGVSSDISVSFGPNQCHGCTLSGVSVLRSSLRTTNTFNVVAAVFSLLARPFTDVPRIEACMSDIQFNLEAQTAQCAGFVHTAEDLTANNNEIQLTISGSGSFVCGLFYYQVGGNNAVSSSNIGVGRSSVVSNVGIAVKADGIDLSQYFVACDDSFMNKDIATCQTEAFMKSTEFLGLLSNQFELEQGVANGFAYCFNTFQNGGSGVVIPAHSVQIDASMWYQDGALLFPLDKQHQFCRGMCYGNYSSPTSFQCVETDIENPNVYCFTLEVRSKFTNESCIEDESRTCDHGQSICTANYEWVDNACIKTCEVACDHGQCYDGQCLCDMYYTGEACDMYQCDYQLQQCAGLGQCTEYEGDLLCQCTDAEKLYEDMQCVANACPGLIANQGICTLEGPKCFEHYRFDGQACNACEEGYEMQGVQCVEPGTPDVNVDNTAAIIGGVCGGACAVILCGGLGYWFVKRRRQTTEETKPLIDQ